MVPHHGTSAGGRGQAQIFYQILLFMKALLLFPVPPSLRSFSVNLSLEAAQDFLSKQENPCRLWILVPWASNMHMLQRKQAWVSDPVAELFPVSGRCDQGYFKTGIEEQEEWISSLWILPVPPGSQRVALGTHGSSTGELQGVKQM